MIVLATCPTCGLFLPPPVPRCPKCGGAMLETQVSGEGEVVASTELHVPPPGWTAPHRLLMVRLEKAGPVLAWARGGPARVGDLGKVELDEAQRFVWTSRA